MRFCLLLLCGLSLGAYAEDVMYAAPDAPELEYQAAVTATTDIRTPTNAILARLPSPAARERVLDRFAHAQSAFLEGSPDEARATFRALVDLLGEDDWRAPERELFALGFLRLAQLESEPERVRTWLKRSLNVFVGAAPVDRSRIPPPILAQLEKLRAQTRRAHPRAIFRSGDWRTILVGGVVCTRANCPEFYSSGEPVRVTFLSDRFVPVTETMHVEEVDTATPTRLPWLTGDCDHPVFHARRIGTPHAFWNLACSAPGVVPLPPPTMARVTPGLRTAVLLGGPSSAGASTRGALGASGSRTTAASAGLDFHPVHASPDPLPAPPARVSTSIWRSGWFWAGVGGAVVAAVVIASQIKQKPEIQPTESY